MSCCKKTMGGSGVGFQDLAKLLSEVISANVYIITADGSILGSGMNQEISLNEEGQTHLQSGVHQKLLEVTQTLANESIQSPYSFVPKELGSLFPQMMTTIVPINAGFHKEAGKQKEGLCSLLAAGTRARSNGI